MDKQQLSKSEFSRYHRHLIMPEFNLEAQLALKNAKVLVIGAGGLGAPVLQYLAAAGVGTLGIVDFDQVDLSNLQRQILFTTADVGKNKADIAKARILAMNPTIEVEVFIEKITAENAFEIINPYDLVVDGSDNFPTRYLVNDACYLLDKVNVFGSIFRFEGQLAVFNYKEKNGLRSANYRDLFPEPPAPGMVPNCAEAGVLGVLPGIIGSMQANETIKVLTGIGEPLINKVLLLDTLSNSQHVVKISRRKENPLSGEHPSIKELIDYEAFCGIPSDDNQVSIKEISAAEFMELKNSEEDFQLIDVREKDEYQLNNINGISIPLSDLENHFEKINRTGKVIIHCQSGKRSRLAIEKLQGEYGFSNLINLKGGILGL